MSSDFGLKIALEGEREFKKALADINQSFKVLDSEMALIGSQFSRNEQSVESLSAKNRVLNREIDLQQDKIKSLERALANADTAFGENDTRTKNWQIQLNRAKATLNDLERELADNTKELNQNNLTLERSARSFSSFGESLKATAKQIGSILAVSAAAYGAFGKNAIETAATVKAENSQFSQAFGDMEDVATTTIQAISKESGIMESRLKSSASAVYAFARSSGGDVEESLALMESALTAAADSSAYYDRSLEDTTESLMSFLKGNFANDAALGVSCTETTRNAKAMELFGKKYNDLTEIQKQQTLLKMVTDAQSLSGAMGQAKLESEGWENVTGNLKESWRQFTAELGVPLLESVIPIIQQITSKLQTLTKETDWKAFGEGITDVFSFFTKHGDFLLSVIAGIGVAFLSWNVIDLLSGVKTALSGVSAAQILLNTVMAANPIAIVITALVALGTALVTLYHTNEDFRNKIQEIWSSIQSVITTIAKEFVTFFNEDIPNAAKAMLNLLFTLPDEVQAIGRDMVSGLWNGIRSKSAWLRNQVTSWCEGILDSVKDFFGIESPSKLFRDEVGKYLADGIGVGFQGELSSVSKEMNRALENSVVLSPSASVYAQETTQNESLIASLLNGLNAINNEPIIHLTAQLVLPNGQIIAETIFNDLLNESKRRGVSLGTT